MKTRSHFFLALTVASILVAAAVRAGDGPSPGKVALQALNDYIGAWKGSGTSEQDKRLIWKEGIDWSWRFQKGKEPSLVFAIDKGKYFKKGELRYLPGKKAYELTLEDVNGKSRVFEGTLKKGKLILERLDADAKEKQKLEMHLAGDGARLIYTYWVMPQDRTLFSRAFQVGYTKQGETFGTAAKKVECIVTGGLGTMPVTYKGVTYYVCCSGCRDAFNETPEKFVKESNAKKKGGN
jgi:hypothetical protein